VGISLGLVGLGRFGSGFAELFRRHPLVSRVALCDREPERAARFARRESWRDKLRPADVYETLDDICRSDLDALVIMTQPWLHAPQCVQAMESGKHVFSAVPILTVPDGGEILEWCDRLVETVRRTGQRYMMGETVYYSAEAVYCRRRAREGAFGAFVHSEGEYFHPFDSAQHGDLRKVARDNLASQAGREWAARYGEYAARGARDGPMHYPTHSLSGPLSVTGAHALKVCAWGTAPHTDDPVLAHNPFSNETALFKMSDGSTLRACEHRECSVGRVAFRIYGTRASFDGGCWISDAEVTRPDVETMREPLPPKVTEAWGDAAEALVDAGEAGACTRLVHEFVEAVVQDRMPAINVWEAVRYMAPGVMAHRSALRDGEVLEVPDWGDPPADRASATSAGGA
jgi:predicted dehydrogenase